MSVSVIIPAYNAAEFLAPTIEGVLSQSRPDWELIVVNDGSTDQTGALAETFSRRDERIRVVHQANRGYPQARNRGFAEARADYEYCMFLDSDDVLEPDALEILTQTLEEKPGALAAHGVQRFIDRRGNPLINQGASIWPGRRRGIQGKLLKIWPVSSPTSFEVLVYTNYIPTCGLMLRRNNHGVKIGFDPGLKYGGDWDLWLRLSRRGDIAFINKVVFARRLHERNLSRVNHAILGESDFLVRHKWYTSAELNQREKQLILLGYRYFELYRARLSLAKALRKLKRGKLAVALESSQAAMAHIWSSLRPAKAIFGQAFV